MSLKPLYFNADETVVVPKDDRDYPSDGREWKFEISRMGWHAVSGTNLEWNKEGYIHGDMNGDAVVENIMWGNTDIKENTTRLKNNSKSTKARLRIPTVATGKKQFWEHTAVDWISRA